MPSRTLIRTGWIVALLACVAGAGLGIATPEDQQQGFLKQLADRTPPAERDCVIAAYRARWPSLSAAYDEANRRRAVRGQTDVVNFVLAQVRPACAAGIAGATGVPATPALQVTPPSP